MNPVFTHTLALAVATASAVGCAGMQSPPEDLLSRVPVVEIGQPEPADQPYVLHIRAGQPVPVHMTIQGPLLLQPAKATTQVQFSQSLYVYKEWSSIDGINWERGAFQGGASLGLAPKGGLVDLRVERVQ
jgi:hypothetical protein